MVLATNGTLVDGEISRRLRDSGIQRVSISIDGATAESHDRFRQMEGAFAGALRGMAFLKEGGLEFQINTTISRVNLEELPAIQNLAVELGAVAHHIFLLVPTGRAKGFREQEIAAADYERTLHWFYDQRRKVPLQLKATCAPHYQRIMRERAREEGETITVKTHGLDAVSRGCLGGSAFLFVSHVGQVQPCGYLELDCGNVRQTRLGEIYRNSPCSRTSGTWTAIGASAASASTGRYAAGAGPGPSRRPATTWRLSPCARTRREPKQGTEKSHEPCPARTGCGCEAGGVYSAKAHSRVIDSVGEARPCSGAAYKVREAHSTSRRR